MTPEGQVISLLVKKDIPYMSVGSTRSSSKRAKSCTGAPVALAVEQDKDDIGPKTESTTSDECVPAEGKFDITQSGKAEGSRERNPYGYSGPLSRECEIPLAVLKHVYETFGSECDEEEWQDQDVAMVAELIFEDTEEGQELIPADVIK